MDIRAKLKKSIIMISRMFRERLSDNLLNIDNINIVGCQQSGVRAVSPSRIKIPPIFAIMFKVNYNAFE